MDWWNFLILIDNGHNYLQLLLPTMIFLSLNLLFKNNHIAIFFFVINLIFLLFINLNNSIGFLEIIKILQLAILPLFIWFLCLKINSKLSDLIQYFALFSLWIFFVTQAIFNGCVIHFLQNWLAQKYLRIEFWHPILPFGSEIFKPELLRFIYAIFSLAIPVIIYNRLDSFKKLSFTKTELYSKI